MAVNIVIHVPAENMHSKKRDWNKLLRLSESDKTIMDSQSWGSRFESDGSGCIVPLDKDILSSDVDIISNKVMLIT